MEVTVILPVRDEERGARETLDDLAAQDLPGLGAVLVDAGSRDGSREVLEGFADALSGWTLVVQEERDLAAAADAGLLFAEGRYLAFLSPGDRFPADYFRTLYEAARRADADLAAPDRASLARVQAGKGRLSGVLLRRSRLEGRGLSFRAPAAGTTGEDAFLACLLAGGARLTCRGS